MKQSLSNHDASQPAASKSADRLLPLVYEDPRKLAARQMANQPPGQTLQATALVHEAWLRLRQSGKQNWDNQGHFFVAAAEAMRRILVENARRKARLKRGGGQHRLDIDAVQAANSAPEDKVLVVHEALERPHTEDPPTARVVSLKFFGGLTNREVAQTLDVTEHAVERDWAFGGSWLYRAIQKELDCRGA
jgi:RNA polymerase sigma factor (TIGR02999 family)